MVQSRVTFVSKTKWSSSEESFARFLAWLDNGTASNGHEYIALRQRLVSYFERKGCEPADDLADETLERVNRRLDQVGAIDAETPAKFCYITAKFVFLEYLRSGKRKEHAADGKDLEKLVSGDPYEEDSDKERLSRSLDKCLIALAAEDRDLILGYYFGERRAKIDHRRSLSEKLGITTNALAIRACRIRERLENCIKERSRNMK